MKSYCPNCKIIFFVTLFFGLFGLPKSSWAATYYVRTDGHDTASGANDTNDSSTGAFRTFQKCHDTATTGDTCLIDPGDYSSANTTLTTTTPRITFRKNGSGTVTVGSIVITSDNVTIDGVTSVKTVGSYPTNIWVGTNFKSVTGVTVTNCRIVSGYEHSEATAGLRFYGGGNIVSNTTFDGDYLNGHDFYYGLLFMTGNGNTVLNNIFTGMREFDAIIWFSAGNNHLVENNTIYNISASLRGYHQDFMQLYVGPSTGNIIDGNIIYNSPGLQIGSIEPSDGTGENAQNWIMRNNIFVASSALFLGGKGWTIVNNDFYEVGGSGAYALYLYKNTGSDASNAVIKNNAFIGCGEDDDYNGWYLLIGSPTGVDADYNYVTKTAAASYGVKSGWSEMHGVSAGDPKFVAPFTDCVENNCDFRLQTKSPMIDKGISIATWANPLNRAGVSRPQGTAADIGAYEDLQKGDTTPPAAPTGLSVN